MTDTITIPRALLEQALNALTYKGHSPWADKEHFIDALRAELAKPRLDQAETNKRLQALADSEGTRAVEYLRWARKAESEIERLRAELAKPEEAVEPVAWMWQHEETGRTGFIDTSRAKYWAKLNPRQPLVMPVYKHPRTPAWHDAPEVAALKVEQDELLIDAERYRWCVANNMVLSGGSSAFGWPIAPVGRAEWDRYIDAAISKAEGRKE